MDKQFESDVDPKRIRNVADGLRRQGEFESSRMLNAYADRLEADEKVVPEAWQYFLGEHWYTVGSDEPWRSKGMPVRKLYAHPAPVDAERLAEALRELENDLRDPFDEAGVPRRQRFLSNVSIADRLAKILQAPSAQAHPGDLDELRIERGGYAKG